MNSKSHAAMIFAEIHEDRRPSFWKPFFGKRAYEAYQTYVYLEQLLGIQNDPGCTYWSPADIYLYAALRLFGTDQACEFVEIGSTLYAIIDILEKANMREGDSFSFDKTSFIGVEASEFFMDLAELLHPNHSLKHFYDYKDIPLSDKVRIGRSYQATSYAFESTRELLDWTISNRFSALGTWFSLNFSTERKIALGKQLMLFDLNEYCAGLKASGFKFCPINCIKVTHGSDLTFYEIWYVTHNLNEQEIAQYNKIVQESKLFPNSPNIDLSKSVTVEELLNNTQISERKTDYIDIRPELERGMFDVDKSGQIDGLNLSPDSFNFQCPETEQYFLDYLSSNGV